MEPGVEPVGVAQRRQVPPGSDEGVLGRVLREVGVAKEESSDRVQPIDGAGREHAEGLTVSASRPIDELRLHARLPSEIDDLSGHLHTKSERGASRFKVRS